VAAFYSFKDVLTGHWSCIPPICGVAGQCQVSNSPTFYEQLLRQNPFAKELQTQIVST